MTREILPVTEVRGEIDAPPSKAHTLRAIIIASLAEGKSTLKKCLLAEDQMFAIKAMEMLGAKINVDKENKLLEITGVNGEPVAPEKDIFIGNSGVTVRLLVSIAGFVKEGERDYVILDGIERMRNGRPIQDLLDALKGLGVEAESLNKNGCPPIKIKCNSFEGGETNLEGNKSSQYFSSILIAAPYAKNNTIINTVGELSSKPYIDITLDSMKEFGVNASHNNYKKFEVSSNQKYIGRELDIEGDYSNAAYFFAAAAVCKGKIKVNNLRIDSAQGDKYFVDALEKMGCNVEYGEDSITLEGRDLTGLGEVDMNNYPDIVMPLAVVASFAKGKTKFTNIAHLRFKESDRLQVTIDELNKLGVDIIGDDDSITINGDPEKELNGAVIDSHNDHRVVMSFAVAGFKVKGITIENEEAVGKSYPEFFDEIENILVRK